MRHRTDQAVQPTSASKAALPVIASVVVADILGDLSTLIRLRCKLVINRTVKDHAGYTLGAESRTYSRDSAGSRLCSR